MGKDHYGEWAGQVVFTEIEKVDPLGRNLHPDNFSSDAFGFADMLAGLMNGNTVGGGKGSRINEEQRDQGGNHPSGIWSRCRASPGRTAEGGCPYTSGAASSISNKHELILGRRTGGVCDCER